MCARKLKLSINRYNTASFPTAGSGRNVGFCCAATISAPIVYGPGDASMTSTHRWVQRSAVPILFFPSIASTVNNTSDKILDARTNPTPHVFKTLVLVTIAPAGEINAVPSRYFLPPVARLQTSTCGIRLSFCCDCMNVFLKSYRDSWKTSN